MVSGSRDTIAIIWKMYRLMDNLVILKVIRIFLKIRQVLPGINDTCLQSERNIGLFDLSAGTDN